MSLLLTNKLECCSRHSVITKNNYHDMLALDV